MNFSIVTALFSPSSPSRSRSVLLVVTARVFTYRSTQLYRSSLFRFPFDSTNLQANRGSPVSCLALRCEYYFLSKRHPPWRCRCGRSHPPHGRSLAHQSFIAPPIHVHLCIEVYLLSWARSMALLAYSPLHSSARELGPIAPVAGVDSLNQM